MRSLAEYLAAKIKAKERKAKRRAKRVELKIGDLASKGDMKKKIVRVLGLLDRKTNGNGCRIHPGEHAGTLAYHLIPQQRGDAARFLPENVVWACRGANFGELKNRSLYREKHCAIFGRAAIERIESIAMGTAHFSSADLRAMFEVVRFELEAARPTDYAELKKRMGLDRNE